LPSPQTPPGTCLRKPWNRTCSACLGNRRPGIAPCREQPALHWFWLARSRSY
jgi:hypothetical protein